MTRRPLIRWRIATSVIGTLLLAGILAGCGDPAVPDVAPGASRSEAENSIAAAGLRAKAVWVEDDAIAAGTVVSLDPPAGTSQPEGATVTVSLSAGRPFSATEVLTDGHSAGYTEGPSDVDPGDVLVASDWADQFIAIGDTPKTCWGVEPGDVRSAAKGSEEITASRTLTTVIIETASPSVAQSLVGRQRAANAACVASGQLNWQTNPYSSPVGLMVTNAAIAPVAGYPAYLTSGAVTSTGSGTGEAFRGAEVMWPQGKYLLAVRDQEDLGRTLGTLGWPAPPSGPPDGLEEAVNELRSAMSAELSRLRRDAAARAAAGGASSGTSTSTTASDPGGARSSTTGGCTAYGGADQPELGTRSGCDRAGSGLCDAKTQLRSWGVSCEDAKRVMLLVGAGETDSSKLDGFTCTPIIEEDPARCVLGSRLFEFYSTG